jgi:NADH dehydrogenase
LSPAEIAQPIRSVLASQRNVEVLMAEVVRIDLEAREVFLDDGDVESFDFLVIAVGAETSYFGHDDWTKVAPGLKNIEDAVEIRQRVLLAFELAEREEDEQRRADLLSFVVIGGGPTGVELAGALAELAYFVLARDFRHIDPSHAKVRLLEAGPRILPSFTEDLAESALEQLREIGVEVRTGARVTSIETGCIRLGDETIPCSVVLWAAGVRANPLTLTLKAQDVDLDRAGRVKVDKDLSIPRHPRVFVIGDAALFLGDDGHPLPGVSPVAMQQARTVAKSIKRAMAGKELIEFHYFDKGSMATIGRRRAVAQVRKMHMSGFIAWLAWLFVHIWYLIGFKNRLVVMIVWAWSYFTYRRGSRLIVGYAAPDANRALLLPPKSERPAQSSGAATGASEAVVPR